jgi:hypothetical protein
VTARQIYDMRSPASRRWVSLVCVFVRPDHLRPAKAKLVAYDAHLTAGKVDLEQIF